MGQANPFRPLALVVEDDWMQREMLAMLLEQSNMQVIQCESAEAAATVLNKIGTKIALTFTDINLAGDMTGVELAFMAKRKFPNMHVIVTSGGVHDAHLPDGAKFIPKPWAP